jgi:DNA-binding NarL/FixJ family response regulator
LQCQGDVLRQAAAIAAATAAEEPAAGTAAPAVAVVNRVPLDAETPTQSDDALPAQTRSEQQRLARRDRRLARERAVVAATQQGMTVRAIARSVGLARGTVRSSLRAEAFPEQGARARRSRLAPYET